MINLPISDYVKKYYKEHDIVLDDFTQATIIWIFHLCWEETLSMLQEIADRTEDEALKLQIRERVEFELQKKEEFMDNHDRKYIYNVIENDDGFGFAYFTTVEQALEYGKRNCESDLRIDKYPLNPVNDQCIVKNRTCIWDKSGSTIMALNPFSYGDFEVPEETHGRKERFEEAFIHCEFPFERGDIVRHIVTGKIGVLENSREDWERLLERVDSGELYGNAGDIVVSVDYVDEEDGHLYYDHRSLLNLEKVTEFNSIEEKELMECISKILQGKEMLTNYGYCLRRYLDSLQVKSGES